MMNHSDFVVGGSTNHWVHQILITWCDRAFFVGRKFPDTQAQISRSLFSIFYVVTWQREKWKVKTGHCLII